MTRKEALDKVAAALLGRQDRAFLTPEANEASTILVALDALGLVKFDKPITPAERKTEAMLDAWYADPEMWGTHGAPGEAKRDRLKRDIVAALT